jgi:hypothetical protein
MNSAMPEKLPSLMEAIGRVVAEAATYEEASSGIHQLHGEAEWRN